MPPISISSFAACPVCGCTSICFARTISPPYSFIVIWNAVCEFFNVCCVVVSTFKVVTLKSDYTITLRNRLLGLLGGPKGLWNSKEFDGIGMTNSFVMHGSLNECDGIFEFHWIPQLKKFFILWLNWRNWISTNQNVVKFHYNSFKVKFLEWIPILSNSIMRTKSPLRVVYV